MSTNSLTYAAATGITTDTQRETIEHDAARYSDALRAASRAVLDGVDAAAAYAYESARRIAHVAVDHGNLDLILDQIERAYA